MRDDGLWDQVRGNWNQLKGKFREKWGLLTDDDLEHIAGHKDRLIGKIQEKYGEAKWNARSIENEIRSMQPPPPQARPRRARKRKWTRTIPPCSCLAAALACGPGSMARERKGSVSGSPPGEKP